MTRRMVRRTKGGMVRPTVRRRAPRATHPQRAKMDGGLERGGRRHHRAATVVAVVTAAAAVGMVVRPAATAAGEGMAGAGAGAGRRRQIRLGSPHSAQATIPSQLAAAVEVGGMTEALETRSNPSTRLGPQMQWEAVRVGIKRTGSGNRSSHRSSRNSSSSSSREVSSLIPFRPLVCRSHLLCNQRSAAGGGAGWEVR